MWRDLSSHYARKPPRPNRSASTDFAGADNCMGLGIWWYDCLRSDIACSSNLRPTRPQRSTIWPKMVKHLECNRSVSGFCYRVSAKWHRRAVARQSIIETEGEYAMRGIAFFRKSARMTAATFFAQQSGHSDERRQDHIAERCHAGGARCRLQFVQL